MIANGIPKRSTRQFFTSALALLYGIWWAPIAQAYSFNMLVPDVRQPPAISGGSACPVLSRQLTMAGGISVQWSTMLNTNPVTILTQNQTASARLTEIEQTITQSLAVWTGVTGTLLLPGTFTSLTRTATQNACGADGLNSICFDQMDMAFTPGVLAFTRVITADVTGIQIGSSAVSTKLGQILDADIYFSPGDPNTTFATPLELPASPKAYDLESVLTHELGHFLGFGHSAVWGAMMYPYAPAPGTISGMRPTTLQPDAPLGDDDRTIARFVPRSCRHAASRIHQRQNHSRKSARASRFPAGRDRSFWRASCRRGQCNGHGDWRNVRRMELLGAGAGSV